MTSMHTPGPWAWRKLGADWSLHAGIGTGQIVLAAGLDNSIGSWDPPGIAQLYVRDAQGVLVPLTPDHPDARLIALAPELFAVCEIIDTITRTAANGSRYLPLIGKSNVALCLAHDLVHTLKE